MDKNYASFEGQPACAFLIDYADGLRVVQSFTHDEVSSILSHDNSTKYVSSPEGNIQTLTDWRRCLGTSYWSQFIEGQLIFLVLYSETYENGSVHLNYQFVSYAGYIDVKTEEFEQILNQIEITNSSYIRFLKIQAAYKYRYRGREGSINKYPTCTLCPKTTADARRISGYV